jgi:hypothetical protein
VCVVSGFMYSLSQENRLDVFDNKVFRRIFWPKGERLAERRIKMH